MQMVIERTLERHLRARTPEGHELRMVLMRLLLESEPQASQLGCHAPKPVPQGLLTTAEAAELLNLSRPHVAMLADIGQLGEVWRTEGGHRRLRASAVRAYAAATPRTAPRWNSR